MSGGVMSNKAKTMKGQNSATVNQHPPAHREGWMVSGQETVFCWVPVPQLTMVVSSVAFFLSYLFINNPQAGC